MDDEAGFLTELEVEAVALRPVDGVVPRLRCGSDTELADGIGGDAALGEVVAGDLAGGFGGEALLPSGADRFVQLEELILDAALVEGGGIVLVLDRDAGAFCEAFDGATLI